MSVRFSVVVPLYNKADYIVRTLESVACQSFGDFEILVINDCSTDDGPARAADFLARSGLTYWLISRGARGGSVGPPRNTGVRAARGELVAFLDADDEWHPDFLLRIDELSRRFPEADAFGSARQVRDGDRVVSDPYVAKFGDGAMQLIFGLREFLEARRHAGNPFRIQAMAFRPEALDDVGGFIHAPRSSDVDLMFRFFLRKKRAAWTSFIGITIHRVPGSVMATHANEPNRPWHYTLRHAIDRGELDPAIIELLSDDLCRSKTRDLIEAIKARKLDRSYFNNIFVFRTAAQFTRSGLGAVGAKIRRRARRRRTLSEARASAPPA